MGKHVQRQQEDRQEQAYYAGQQDASAGGQPAMAGSSSSLITSEATQRLSELGKLHEQGVLTDDEFAVQKAKILGAG